MFEGAVTAVAGRTPPPTPGGEPVHRPKHWHTFPHEYLEDPAQAIGAAWELARWERDEQRATILKRVKDAADARASVNVEGDEPETTAERASRGASATTASRSTGDLTASQAAQLRAQVAAFGRLARGLTVPAGLMTAAAAGNPTKPTSAAISAAFPSENEKAGDDHDDDDDPETERIERRRLLDAKISARADAIDALPDTLPDEIRLPAVIEGKALRLVELQRKVRFKIAAESRAKDLCRDPDALLDMRPARMPSDPNTYVAAISRHAAARMHQMHSRMQQEAELKRRRELHARMAAARLREDKKRMEAERRAQAEISRKQRLAMSLARKKEIDGRVAVVRERRVWLAQMFAHAKALEKAEKDSKHRLRKRNNGVLSYHRKQQNAEAREERARIEALKAGDEEAYLRLVQDSKDQRIEELLSTTDDLLKHLAEKIDATKAAARRAMEDPDVLDPDAPPEDDVTDEAGTPRGKEKYSAIRQFTKLAHSADVEEIVVQPSILIGPNGAGAMRSYQLAGLQWMVSLYNNQLNGILADEMGLGKTIQCISLLAYLAENKGVKGPHLILAPKAVLPNWAREFKIWYPDCDVVMYDGYKDARKEMRENRINEGAFDVLLTHYDLAMYDKTWLSKIEWNYIVVDEGHRLKNHQSKLSTVLQAAYTASHRLLLTGTPIQNNLTELWALLNFLLPSVFNSTDAFEAWFNAPFAASKEDVALKEEEELLIIQRLHQVLRPFLLRRKKNEVEKELPEKEEETIKCAMSAWQKAYYRQVVKGTVTNTDGKVRVLQNTAMQLRKVCNHPYLFLADDLFYRPSGPEEILRASGKFELLDRILPKLKRSGHRVLLFSQMVKCLDIIGDYLDWRRYDYLRLDGSTGTQDRADLLDKFNAPDSPHFLFMLSTRAGGMGLNLQTADTVIIFDSDWNPQMDAQAEDRAHRIGQTRRVKVFTLVCDGTIEEDILRKANEKRAIDHKAIQAGMFNQASTAEERNSVLKQILSRDEDRVGNDVPTDEEVNLMIARSDEEVELFEEMDRERERANRVNHPGRSRLMEYHEIPKEVRNRDDASEAIDPGARSAKLMNTKRVKIQDQVENVLSSEDDGEGGRRRRRRSAAKEPRRYDDGLSETAFVRVLEKGGGARAIAAASERKLKLREKKRGRGRSATPGMDEGEDGSDGDGAGDGVTPKRVKSATGPDATGSAGRGRGRPKKRKGRPKGAKIIGGRVVCPGDPDYPVSTETTPVVAKAPEPEPEPEEEDSWGEAPANQWNDFNV